MTSGQFGHATRSKQLLSGLDPTLKSARLANDLAALREELIRLANACAQVDPALVPIDPFDVIDGFEATSAREIFGSQTGWGLPHESDREDLRALLRASAS